MNSPSQKNMAEFRAKARQAREENFKARRQATNSLKNMFQMSKKNIKRMIKSTEKQYDSRNLIFAKAHEQAEAQERAARGNRNTRKLNPNAAPFFPSSKTRKFNLNATPFFPTNLTIINVPEENDETRTKQISELRDMGSRLPNWLNGRTRRGSRF
jgi:hypothetical protein